MRSLKVGEVNFPLSLPPTRERSDVDVPGDAERGEPAVPALDPPGRQHLDDFTLNCEFFD